MVLGATSLFEGVMVVKVLGGVLGGLRVVIEFDNVTLVFLLVSVKLGVEFLVWVSRDKDLLFVTLIFITIEEATTLVFNSRLPSTSLILINGKIILEVTKSLHFLG